MKVLLIGGGGREHAMAWKLNQSALLKKLFVSPGNAGTEGIAENILLNSQQEIKDFIEKQKINLLIVGPEQPLVDGLIDYLQSTLKQKCILFGPPRQGAMLEGSKDFAKGFMYRNKIPTAAYKTFNKDKVEHAIQYIKEGTTPVVLKADGLAAGKGVVIHEDKLKAISDLESIFDGRFGEAGSKVIIEQFLKGPEFSVFIATDSKDYILLPVAKDYKRIHDGDKGLNTGGMGSVSPVSFVDKKIMDKVIKRIIEPTLDGLQKEQIPYKGFLFFGLILVQGEPFVIEYNCRMGDPETQSVFPRIDADLLELILSIEKGNTSSFINKIKPKVALSVVLASQGYPGDYQTGYPIDGLEKNNLTVFQAGTRVHNGDIVTNGGRVVAVTSFGNTVTEAQENTYRDVKQIVFKGKTYRTDIGDDLIKL